MSNPGDAAAARADGVGAAFLPRLLRQAPDGER
jgi:hypothetical protein